MMDGTSPDGMHYVWYLAEAKEWSRYKTYCGNGDRYGYGGDGYGDGYGYEY